VPKSTALDDRYALYCRKYASFGAHHKKLNEDRRILSAAKMLVSGDIRFMLIFSEIPWEGASNDSGVVEKGNIQRFRWIFFGNFRDEANVIT